MSGSVATRRMMNERSKEGTILASEPLPYDIPTTDKRSFDVSYGSTVLGQGLTLGLGIVTATCPRGCCAQWGEPNMRQS